MTEDNRTFNQRLSDAGAEVSYLEKGGFNKHFKYSFLQEAEVKRAVGAALRKHGLTLTTVRFAPIGEVTGQAAVLECTVDISDAGQERARFQGVGAGTDSSDKAPMKACAAALKYALTSGFLIATGDDPEDDGGTKADKAPKKADAVAEPEAAANEKAATSSPEQRVAKALAYITSADSQKELNMAKLELAKLSREISKELYEPVRLAFMERTKALTEKKES